MVVKKIITIGISTLLIIILLSFVGFDKISQIVSSADLVFLIYFLVVFLVIIGLNALALWFLVHAYSRISFQSFWSSFAISWSVASFLPGRIGDLSITFFHEKLKLTRSRLMIAVVVDKIVTLAAIVVLAWIILFIARLDDVQGLVALGTLLVIGIFLLGGFLVYFRKHVLTFLSNQTGLSFIEVGKDIRLLFERPELLIMNVILTLIRLVLQGIGFWLLLLAVGVEVPWIISALFVTLSGLAVFFPFTFNGTGIRESLLILFFGSLGVTVEHSLAAGILQLVLSYVFVALFIGLYWNEIRALLTKK